MAAPPNLPCPRCGRTDGVQLTSGNLVGTCSCGNRWFQKQDAPEEPRSTGSDWSSLIQDKVATIPKPKGRGPDVIEGGDGVRKRATPGRPREPAYHQDAVTALRRERARRRWRQAAKQQPSAKKTNGFEWRSKNGWIVLSVGVLAVVSLLGWYVLAPESDGEVSKPVPKNIPYKGMQRPGPMQGPPPPAPVILGGGQPMRSLPSGGATTPQRKP